MRPPTLTAASGGALRELTCPNVPHPTKFKTCCPTAQVLAQLWMDGQGGLGLAMANPTNETVSVAAAVRVDGHTRLAAGGRPRRRGARSRRRDAPAAHRDPAAAQRARRVRGGALKCVSGM